MSKNRLLQHLYTHHIPKLCYIDCEECGNKSIEIINFKAHMWEEHKVFICLDNWDKYSSWKQHLIVNEFYPKPEGVDLLIMKCVTQIDKKYLFNLKMAKVSLWEYPIPKFNAI